jgi:hypothetical protein
MAIIYLNSSSQLIHHFLFVTYYNRVIWTEEKQERMVKKNIYINAKYITL